MLFQYIKSLCNTKPGDYVYFFPNEPAYYFLFECGSLKTWRPDNIMENVQVPEVVRYIHEKYGLHKNMGDVLILKRSAV